MNFPATFTDQMNNEVTLTSPPERIISLVPSQTELLFDLGLEREVVGITKFCVHPDSWYRNKPRVGGTKQIDFDKIKKLNPDLIIGNKEENDRIQIEALIAEYPVWMSDIDSIEAAKQMIRLLGTLTGKDSKAEDIISGITASFEKVAATTGSMHHPRALYLIWQNPIMCAGNGTFIDNILKTAGYANAVSAPRYPELTHSDIDALKPEIILLSSEPYPFTDKHIAEFTQKHPYAKVFSVDGEIFSWYGSRLLKVPDYLVALRNITG